MRAVQAIYRILYSAIFVVAIFPVRASAANNRETHTRETHNRASLLYKPEMRKSETHNRETHNSASLQQDTFTHEDTLMGANSPERRCYDVRYYDLFLQIDPARKSLTGSNAIYFTVTEKSRKIQVDLSVRFQILGVRFDEEWLLHYDRKGNHLFITTPDTMKPGDSHRVEIHYTGEPVTAKKPPWEGGFVWAKDSMGKPWIGVACEEIGASSWWPCKDYLGDEPDSMRMSFEVPAGMNCVSNGRLMKISDDFNGFNKFEWKVAYPINTYDVTVNIGNFERMRRYYTRKDSSALTLDYYVFPWHADQADRHFQQVLTMLQCFEYYFGRYPFEKDGYGLVETPYWGMEHQGAIAYGNHFKNNAFGFDFIVIHESAHEWWGNNISCADPAEMWLHESFATYAEALYVEYMSGYERSLEYLKTQKPLIKNEKPMIGPMGVNYRFRTDNDIYYKGTWMLHTLRHVINNDSAWYIILRYFQEEHQFGIVTTRDFIDMVNRITKKDYSAFFEEYLTQAAPPKLDLSMKKRGKNTTVTYRWDVPVKGFDMPVELFTGTHGEKLRIYPVTGFSKKTKIRGYIPSEIKLNSDEFYFVTE